MNLDLRRLCSCLGVQLLLVGLAPGADVRSPELTAVQIEGWTRALGAKQLPVQEPVVLAKASVPVMVQDVPSQEAPPPGAKKLNILILKGDGAINNIKARTARETIVEVRDENNKPVAGAAVVFLFPNNGPGVITPSGTNTVSTMSDAQGRAAVRGLKSNGQSGKYNVQVRANYQQSFGQVSFVQSNLVAAAGAVSGLTLGLIVAAGAAAGAGAYLGTRGGGTPARPTVGVNAGTPSAGPPK